MLYVLKNDEKYYYLPEDILNEVIDKRLKDINVMQFKATKEHWEREEAVRFHRDWKTTFIMMEKQHLNGIGFNPRVQIYTIKNIVDYIEIYKSKRRYRRPSESFMTAIKWLMVCTVGLILGLKSMELGFVHVYEKENKKTLQRQALKIKELERRWSSNRRLIAKLSKEPKKTIIPPTQKKEEKQNVSKNKKSKRICQSAKVFSGISKSKNILIGAVYKNGDRYECKIYLDRDIPCCPAGDVYKKVGNKLCDPVYCSSDYEGLGYIQHIEVNN